MTLKGFISCARGINDGKNFPLELLRTLYKNIAADPLAVHEIERR